MLHHFPNKKALLAGLLEFSMNQLETRAEAQREDIQGENPHLRSFIKAAQVCSPDQRTLPISVLTAAAEDKELLMPMKEYSQYWCDKVEAESCLGLVLLLAVEGLQFLEMFDLLEMSTEKRHSTFQKMLDLLERVDLHPGQSDD